MEQTKLYKNEHIEYLKPNFGLVVSPAHTFGTDAVLLAHFAAPKKNTLACDMGTGCGIIPMLWCRDGLCRRVDGVEIQDAGYGQFARSIAANGLEEKAFAHLADLKALDSVLPREKYDLVTMNPPYKAVHTGILSDSAHEQIARHETACTLAEISAAAGRLLKYGGRFCLCIRPERLFETMQAMANAKIEPKKMRLVSKNPHSAPWLCLLEGRKGGKHGLQVLNGLYVYDENGELSVEMRRIYGAYKEEGQR